MEDNYKKILGIRLNTALAAANMKQKELAKLLGVTDNTISYFCSGKRIPNIEQLIQISKFLNVSTDFLLGLSDVKSTDADIKSVCDFTRLNENSLTYLTEMTSLVNFRQTLNSILGTKQGRKLLFFMSDLLTESKNYNESRLLRLNRLEKINPKEENFSPKELFEFSSIGLTAEKNIMPIEIRALKSDTKEVFDQLLNEIFIEKLNNEDEIRKREIEVTDNILGINTVKEDIENGNN